MTIENLGNGIVRVFDRASRLTGLYRAATGEHHSGDLRGHERTVRAYVAGTVRA